jgi:hypothetical protein
MPTNPSRAVDEAVEEAVEEIAAEAVALVTANAGAAAVTSAADGRDLRVSAAALDRLGRLLGRLAESGPADDDLRRATARLVLQTWITGHAALVLGDSAADDLDRQHRASRAALTGTSPELDLAPAPTLPDLARRLDLAAYGTVDPPRAFQRHVASFTDEIDVTGVEGTASYLLAPPTDGATRADFVRVALWVVLFLAFDHCTASGDAPRARAARALFDRLRAATDDLYARRRQARSTSS